MRGQHLRYKAVAGVFVAAIAAVGACGDDGGPTAGDSQAEPAAGEVTPAEGSTEYPLVVDNCGMEVSFDEPPDEVLILGDVTEGEVGTFLMLGILASAQDIPASDHPELVERGAALPTGGLEENDNFVVPAEQVLSLQPDLVVGARPYAFDADQGAASREELADVGIPSLVTPANCAQGRPDASAEERAATENQSIESSFELIQLIGQIFDVSGATDELVGELSGRIEAVEARVEGEDPRSVLFVYPGMTSMNATGMPAVFAGGIYDDVITRAGGVNVFAGENLESAASISEEELASADVDVLLVGQFRADEDPDADAARLFEQFPEWEASRTGTYATVADGDEIGPTNAWFIESFARVLHPDAF